MLNSEITELQNLLHILTDDPIPGDDWPGPDHTYGIPSLDDMSCSATPHHLDQPQAPHLMEQAPTAAHMDAAPATAPMDHCPPPEHMDGYSSAEDLPAPAAPSASEPASPGTPLHPAQGAAQTAPGPQGTPGARASEQTHDHSDQRGSALTYTQSVLAMLTRTAHTARELHGVHAQHCCYATAGMCASASCTVCRRPREPGAHGAVCSDAGLVHGMLLDASVLARRLVAERAGLRAAAEWRGPPAGSPAYAADEAAFSGIMAALQPNPHLMVNTMWTSVRESIHDYCRVVTGAATGGPAVAGAPPQSCPLFRRPGTDGYSPPPASRDGHSGMSSATGSPRRRYVASSVPTIPLPRTPSSRSRQPPDPFPRRTPEGAIDPREFAIVVDRSPRGRGSAGDGCGGAGGPPTARTAERLAWFSHLVETNAPDGIQTGTPPGLFSGPSDPRLVNANRRSATAPSGGMERTGLRGSNGPGRGGRRGSGGAGGAPGRGHLSPRRPAQRKTAARRTPRGAAAASSFHFLPAGSTPGPSSPQHGGARPPVAEALSPLCPQQPPGAGGAWAVGRRDTEMEAAPRRRLSDGGVSLTLSLHGGMSLDDVPSIPCDASVDDRVLYDFLQ